MSKLAKWLTKDSIQYLETVADWKAAINMAGQPMLEQGAITWRYVESIIKQKEAIGPYFVIAPRIAMPHARPEEGGLALGLSVLKLGQGVNFDADENDPVDVIFMFSAPDSNSHIEMISELAEVLSDDEAMEKIYQAKSHDELVSFFLN